MLLLLAAKYMHHRDLYGRGSCVTISSRRFSTGNLSGPGNQLDTQWGGVNIWDCSPMLRARERD